MRISADGKSIFLFSSAKGIYENEIFIHDEEFSTI